MDNTSATVNNTLLLSNISKIEGILINLYRNVEHVNIHISFHFIAQELRLNLMPEKRRTWCPRFYLRLIEKYRKNLAKWPRTIQVSRKKRSQRLQMNRRRLG